MKKILAALVCVALAGNAWAECVPARDKAGKIKRSMTELAHFKKLHPCPANGATSGACPGYVIDHVITLACCGEDKVTNMQWQTIAEGKAKDKVERLQCGDQ